MARGEESHNSIGRWYFGLIAPHYATKSPSGLLGLFCDPARLVAGRSRRFRLGRLRGRLNDLDANDLGRVAWHIVARIGRHARDLLHHVDILALSEDGVVAVEMRRGNVGNEELRAVGIGPAIGHRQASGLVELERGTELIFEAVAGITCSVTDGVATLNHEVWNDTMEDGAVVQRHALHHL